MEYIFGQSHFEHVSWKLCTDSDHIAVSFMNYGLKTFGCKQESYPCMSIGFDPWKVRIYILAPNNIFAMFYFWTIIEVKHSTYSNEDKLKENMLIIYCTWQVLFSGQNVQHSALFEANSITITITITNSKLMTWHEQNLKKK